MKIFVLVALIYLGGCATKYIIPGNRFITPESQGQAFRGQIELQQTNANQLTIDVSQNTIDQGVLYGDLNRLGFLFSHSFFEQFDAVWTHTGSGNSLIGGKFQLFGASRTANGTGHKLSIAALVGGNEHETEDKAVEFKLGGQEFLVVYGYRFSEMLLSYLSFSRATYDFEGRISSPDPALNGAEPKLKTAVNSVGTGLQLDFNSIFAKGELTAQQLQTTDTKEKIRFAIGYSMGFGW